MNPSTTNRSTRIIAWDRDNTLGCFDRMGARMKGFDPKEIDEEYGQGYLLHGLKPGIVELLADLFHEGYRHYIVTAGSPERAAPKLQMSGLHPFFELQFAGEKYLETSSKFYRSVLQSAGIDIEDAPERLLVVGDNLNDLPGDLLDVVFINHENGCFYHSDVLRHIIRELHKPEGGFIAGFNELYARAESRDGKDYVERYGFVQRTNKTVDIGNGVKITLGDSYNLMTKEQDGRYVGTVPTITEIEAPDYRRAILDPMQTVTTIDQLGGYDKLEEQAEALLSDRAKAQRIIHYLKSSVQLVVEVEPPVQLSVQEPTDRRTELEIIAEQGLIFDVRPRPNTEVTLERKAERYIVGVPLPKDIASCREDSRGYVSIVCNGER
ncbi:hypothetical protein HYW21_00760 [Candidatus Woesearchaeota archaeon]|nr:hypothetical protein [Candidatus Woesearchaeota archaeon]